MKWLLNKKSHTTLSNYKKIIPELAKITKAIPSEGKSDREVLHIALRKMGWSTKDIKKLSQKTEKARTSDRNISPSFELYKSKNSRKTIAKGKSYRSVQGGSPGLGKKK